MDVVWKSLLGGLLTMLIVLAAKRGTVLPGILPLVPTFAIVALLVVGSRGDPAGFKTAALAGIKTIPAYLVFLVGCYLLADHVDHRVAILGGMAAWLVAAAVIFLVPRLF